MIEDIITLGFLVLLQAVLGFDNLLYLSLESRKAPKEKQAFVRKVGIALAIVLRIVLLFVLLALIDAVEEPFFGFDSYVITGEFNLHSIIVLLGGAFILYTATKEIWHMMSLREHEETTRGGRKTVGQAIMMIVLMNLVFSFDSILSAIALTDEFWVMATAIVIGGALMILLADKVANFLERNRMYEVLGLFILFLVGVMLLSEGGHLSHLHLFGSEITPMSKATFYFVIAVLVLTDVVQGRYKRKLSKEKQRRDAVEARRP